MAKGRRASGGPTDPGIIPIGSGPVDRPATRARAAGHVTVSGIVGRKEDFDDRANPVFCRALRWTTRLERLLLSLL